MTNHLADSQQKQRPTIGLLTRELTYSWAVSQLQGIVDACREQNVNLICFPGRHLIDPELDVQGNIAYDLAIAGELDGFIILSSAIVAGFGQNELEDFYRRFHPAPIVNIELSLPGIPVVLKSEYEAMREILLHLTEYHGYRRIAYVSRESNNPGHVARYQAYLDTLAEYNIPFDPNLVFHSKELPELDERKLRPGIDFEALAANEDEYALPPLQALQDQGIRVPEDVAVIGFDDLAESWTVTPPLTTVRPPFYEMGRKTVEMLLALMVGENVPDEITLPSTLVIRQSCGCMATDVVQAVARSAKANRETFEAVLVDHRGDIVAEMAQAVGPEELISGWAEQLLDDFVAEVKDQSPGLFLHRLSEILRKAGETGSQIGLWQNSLSALRRWMLPCLDDEAFALADDLWQQGRVMIGEMAERAQAYRAVQAEQQARVLREVSQNLMTTFDMEGLMDILAEGLPRLNFPGCYLALYESPQPYLYPQPELGWSRLMLAYDERGRVDLEPGGRRFSTSQLLPEGMWPARQSSFVVQPLYFQDNQLGFAVFEMGPRTGALYEALRGQISSALKGALFLQEHKQIEAALARQAQELTRSNVELEQFAYVASHDLQEPLRMVKSYLQLLERRYQDKLDSDANEFIDFAVDGAARMESLIKDLLKYSRLDTQRKPFEPIACMLVLERVLDNLKIAIEESEAVITWADLPTVMADEVQLTQIFQNLIGNALKFCQPNVRPEIHIGVESKDGEWVFSVQDNGIGIAPEYSKHLFMIFKRLHTHDAYPGTGIGLAICKKIVERHDGRIWIESGGVPGQGTTFYFTLPILSPNKRSE